MSVPERQGDGRAARREFVGSPAMCAAEIWRVSGVYRRGPVTGADDLALDAADRRIASEVAVFTARGEMVFELNPGRPRHQPQSACKG